MLTESDTVCPKARLIAWRKAALAVSPLVEVCSQENQLVGGNWIIAGRKICNIRRSSFGIKSIDFTQFQAVGCNILFGQRDQFLNLVDAGSLAPIGWIFL